MFYPLNRYPSRLRLRQADGTRHVISLDGLKPDLSGGCDPALVIHPPRYVPGMALPTSDYSERLARRTGISPRLHHERLALKITTSENQCDGTKPQ